MHNSEMQVPNMKSSVMQQPTAMQNTVMQSSNMTAPVPSMHNDGLVADPFGNSRSLGIINPIKQEITDNDFQSIIDLDDDLAITDNYEWNTNRA